MHQSKSGVSLDAGDGRADQVSKTPIRREAKWSNVADSLMQDTQLVGR